MKVTVQSKSGEHVFACGEDETLLRAGLRQGIALPYECATGTCGTCRARMVQGEVNACWKEAPGLARFKPEKGDILMCQTKPRSDCVMRVPSDISFFQQQRPDMRRGVIRNVRKLTHDVAHFELQLSEPMRFEAGQFVVVESKDIPGGRAYSMVNFDEHSDLISLVLKRKPGGGFSEWIFAAPRADYEVSVFGPLGRAVFRPTEDKDIVCIAGGSGIAGIMSILAHAVKIDYFANHKGSVFFGVRTAVDTFFLDLLASYVAKSHGNLAVTIALSHETAGEGSHREFPGIRLASGMVHEVAAGALKEGCENAIAYVAGPPVMVNGAVKSLLGAGVSVGSIRYDKFN